MKTFFEPINFSSFFAESSQEYNAIKQKLERLYQRWDEAQAKIETIEASLTTII